MAKRKTKPTVKRAGALRLTVKKILARADAHHRRTGRWPTEKSGPVYGATAENWRMINAALRAGHHGLPSGSSLARLLFRQRGYRYEGDPTPLTIQGILRWADDHRRRTERWPTKRSGGVLGVIGEKWINIDKALQVGRRSLPGGSSLARLLDDERGKRNTANRPRLSIKQILAWADAHRKRTGKWPTEHSGLITGARAETWRAVQSALAPGARGLKGHSSLAQLLEKHRGRPNPANRSRLTVKQVLAWADTHRAREGKWPTVLAGALEDAPDEKWSNIDSALRDGYRGLPGGTSLARLLDKYRRISGHERRRKRWV